MPLRAQVGTGESRSQASFSGPVSVTPSFHHVKHYKPSRRITAQSLQDEELLHDFAEKSMRIYDPSGPLSHSDHQEIDGGQKHHGGSMQADADMEP